MPTSFAIATPPDVLAAEKRAAITVDRSGLGDLELQPALPGRVPVRLPRADPVVIPLAKAKDLAASMRLPSLAGTRMDAFLAAGVAKVARHQQGDGNFSLWPQSEPHPHLTVYALWGLREARRAGVDVPEDVLVAAGPRCRPGFESGDAWKGGDVAVVAMAAYSFAHAARPITGCSPSSTI